MFSPGKIVITVIYSHFPVPAFVTVTTCIPGVMVNKVCFACQAKTVSKRTGRTCDVSTCHNSYHYKCMGLTDIQIETLKKSTIAWTCPSCLLQDNVMNSSTSSVDSSRTVFPGRSSLGFMSSVDLPNVMTLQVSVQSLLKSNTEILKRLIEIEKNTSEIRLLQERMNELQRGREEDKRRIAELEVRLEQAETRAQDCSVEIRGVPVTDGEDLYQRVEELSKAVGAPVARADLSHCSRTRAINVATAGKPRPYQPIIVRFVHKRNRDKFLKLCREQKESPLTTEVLQLPGTPSRIYVNEYLTSTQKTLLFRAKEHFKKKLSYSFVWVQDSKIMIRKDMNTPIQAIRNNADFQKLASIN